MKPPKFHVGQEVVPVARIWTREYGVECSNPKLSKIYQVQAVELRRINNKVGYYLSFAEYPGLQFYEGDWRPVEELPADAFAELLEEAFTITV